MMITVLRCPTPWAERKMRSTVNFIHLLSFVCLYWNKCDDILVAHFFFFSIEFLSKFTMSLKSLDNSLKKIVSLTFSPQHVVYYELFDWFVTQNDKNRNAAYNIQQQPDETICGQPYINTLTENLFTKNATFSGFPKLNGMDSQVSIAWEHNLSRKRTAIFFVIFFNFEYVLFIRTNYIESLWKKNGKVSLKKYTRLCMIFSDQIFGMQIGWISISKPNLKYNLEMDCTFRDPAWKNSSVYKVQ